MIKTVSAEFDSVDMAELAARNIRYKFEGISKIKIKYRNIGDDGYLAQPSAAAPGSAWDMSVSQNSDTDGHTEADENRASRLLIEVSAASASRVAAYLRGLGGIRIKTSDIR